MAKNNVELEIMQGEKPNSTIFVLMQYVGDMSNYQKAKAIYDFVNKETKVLANQIDIHIRRFLAEHNCLPDNFTKTALMVAFKQLKQMYGLECDIIDRYANEINEKKVGFSDNMMTVIEEQNGFLSIAQEVIFMEV